jgi:NDP-sugar pyrophosphorylase family protein
MDRTLFFDTIPDMLQPYFSDERPLWELLNRTGEIIRDIVRRNPECFTEIEKDVFTGEGAAIAPNAVIRGPALIGRGCEIRPGAFLRGNVIIGENCTIGNSTEIKNAILFSHVEASHFNYIGDSILGNYAHLGAGVILSNFRLDKQFVGIKYPNGDRVPTNRQKLGSIIGDHGEIGCNSVLNPGTVLEKKVTVYPLMNITGYYTSGSICRPPPS